MDVGTWGHVLVLVTWQCWVNSWNWSFLTYTSENHLPALASSALLLGGWVGTVGSTVIILLFTFSLLRWYSFSLPWPHPDLVFYYHVKAAVIWACYPHFSQPSMLKIHERAHKWVVLASLCPGLKLLWSCSLLQRGFRHLLHSIAISCKSLFLGNTITEPKALEGQETDFLLANSKSLKEKMLENEPESMGSKTRTSPLQYELLHPKMFSNCHTQALNL